MQISITNSVLLTRLSILTTKSFIVLPVEFEDYNGNRSFEQEFFNPDGYDIRKILVSLEALPDINVPNINKSRIEPDSKNGVFDQFNEFTKYNSRRKLLQFIVSCKDEFLNDITIQYFK